MTIKKPSLAPGFEYDIFISYRQKDNKGERWVTEFVEALKTELESTFKEEISVYFDINPHDGLLETHDVGASLKDKLKCLIFIPVISRTYCDPESFAWEHEFKAFIEQASRDQFGLKVKLPNGNVASRVLPVRIHDLDTYDVKLFEGVTGSPMRTIDFVFKTASGVNRPLKAIEHHPNDNLNKTYYQDQVNKTSLAIRDIIASIRQYGPRPEEDPKEVFEPVSMPHKYNRVKMIVGSAVLLVLLILGYFLIPKPADEKTQIKKSIAVLPFKLLSDEPDKQYLADGMMDAIRLHLSKILDLRVMSGTSVEQYRGTTKTTKQIGKELGIEYLLEGSFQKFGENTKLILQLIKASEGSQAWGNEYESKWNDVFSIQSEVAQSIARELNAVITPEEKQLIEKKPTTNLTAYDFYQRGWEEYMKYWLNNNNRGALKEAETLYRKALKYDSTYAQAYSGLATIYWRKHYYEEYFSKNFLDSVSILADIALSHDPQLSDALNIKGEYYVEKGSDKLAFEEFDKAIKFNPNNWMAYYSKGNLYGDDDPVKSIENLQKSVSLNHGPELPLLLRSIAMRYDAVGFMDKARYYNLETLKLDGDSVNYFTYLSQFERNMGNFENALNLSLKVNRLDSNNLANLFEGVTRNLMFLRRHAESLKYYKIWYGKITALGQFDLGGMHRIGFAYSECGFRKEADFYFNKQLEFCKKVIKTGHLGTNENYTYYDLAGVYAFRGDKAEAYKNLKLLNQAQTFPLWMVTLIKNDPLFDNMKNEPEFRQIEAEIEAKYQAEHERVGKWLAEQGIL